MTSSLHPQDGTIWWRDIAFVPSIHGRAAFARATRQLFLARRFPTVAVELPESLADATLEGIEQLPEISVVSYEESDGTRCFFPIDPCDSIVEALRLGVAENARLEFIDCDVESFERTEIVLPDPYAVQSIGLARYWRAIESALPRPPAGSQDDERERHMALRLLALARGDARSRPVLCVLGLGHVAGVVRHLEERSRQGEEPPAASERRELLQALPPLDVSARLVAEGSLYHVLGELPWITWRWEEARRAITLEEFESTLELKRLLLEAREHYHREHAEEYEHISTGSFQNLLRLVRNLCLLERRLTPSLYQVALAAKGIAGSEFALEVIRTARRYPPAHRASPQQDTSGQPSASGDESPHDGERRRMPVDLTETRMRLGADVVPAKKRYVDEAREWKRLPLRRPPDARERERWRTAWNPLENCSWEPEDRRIENFAGHVRQRAIEECIAPERLEEFTTSLKDGLHVRETIRNLHLGKVIVREVPPVRGRVGAVIVIYEDPDPKRFPWKLTWFSEHEWESTLSFYATDYRRELVGPGIGEALYGGQLFIYPPKPILDVWQDPGLAFARDDRERLVFAGLFHSRDRFVAYVASRPPTLRMKTYASRLGRRLLYLPLSSFSRSTIAKLRRFHVLNGKPVRSYARQFIR